MSQIGRAVVVSLLLIGVATAAACGATPQTVTITIHYSGFDPTELSVPSGVPITFVLVNEDPIDHEWLIGDEGFHEKHRTGSHASHGAVPNEVTIPALETVTTTITFDEPGRLAYICHLPSHEGYGMVGWMTVEG